MKHFIFLLLFSIILINDSKSQNVTYHNRYGEVIKDFSKYEYKVGSNYVIYTSEKRQGVKDSDGNIIIKPEMESVFYIGRDMFIVKDPETKKFKIYKKDSPIDMGGREIDPVFSNYGGFKWGFVEGYACFSAKVNDLSTFYVLDSTGNFLKTTSEPEFHSDFIFFKREKLIYDKTTKEYFDLKASVGEYALGSFSEGLAKVCKSGGPDNYGFINKKGEWVIPMNAKINSVVGFDNGVCKVGSKGEDKWINTSGKFVKRPGDVFIKNITFFQNFRITENTNSELKITDEKTGKQVEGYFSSDYRMVPVTGYYTLNGYLFVDSDNGEKAMIHHSGKVVHRFVKKFETKIFDLVKSQGDLIYVTSEGGNTVIFDMEGNKLWDIPKGLECHGSLKDVTCFNRDFADSIRTVNKQMERQNTGNNSSVDGNHELVEYVFGIVMQKVRGTVNVSVNYACRYFVVTDVSGEGQDAAMRYAQSINSMNYNTDGYVEYDTYATDNIDKCKEEVNKKYKLSDFRVEYITKE